MMNVNLQNCRYVWEIDRFYYLNINAVLFQMVEALEYI